MVNRDARTRTLIGDAEGLLARVAMVELIPEVLDRARQPFPIPLRTLDALHISAADFVRAFRRDLKFATYDERLGEAAETLGLELVL